MKSRGFLIQLGILAIILGGVFAINLALRQKQFASITGFAQGTTYHITYASRSNSDLRLSVDSLLSAFDQSLSIYEPASVISRTNRNEPGTELDDKFIRVFNKSAEVFEKTGGAFDITVGPIVNALGFGSTDTLTVDSTHIDSLLAFVGMEKVRISGRSLIKADPRIVLDVNAIAQGYAVDLVCELLESNGIRRYMVEIGGEVRARGRNPGNRPWRIGVDKPLEGNNLPGENLQAIVSLKNQSLATSGNYRRFYVRDGIKITHTIDPHTGYPVVSNLLSATVVASDCMTADAYATAFMVFGLDRSIAFLQENTFLQALLIYSDETGAFRMYISDGLKNKLSD